jgi:hypothetical protein
MARLFRPECLRSGQCSSSEGGNFNGMSRSECYDNGVGLNRFSDLINVARKTGDGVFVRCYMHKDFVDEMGQRYWVYYDSRRVAAGIVNFPSKDSRTGTAICPGGAQYPLNMDSPQCQDRLKSFGRLDFHPSGPRCVESSTCSFVIVDDLPDAGPG